MDKVSTRSAAWEARQQPVDVAGRERLFAALIAELVEAAPLRGDRYQRIMRRYTHEGLPWLSKSQVLRAYETLCDQDYLE